MDAQMRKSLGLGALGALIVVLLAIVILIQILMWNRAANGQAAFEFLNRQLSGQQGQAPAAPAATAPKAPEPKKD